MVRFTIRDMLWLTVIVAMTLGWVSHYRQQLNAAAAKDSVAWVMAGFITERTGRPVIWDEEGIYIDGTHYAGVAPPLPFPNFNDRLARRDPAWMKFRNLNDEDRWAVEIFTRAAVAHPFQDDLTIRRDSSKKITVIYGNEIQLDYPEMPVFP